jgi:hypothetical protein
MAERSSAATVAKHDRSWQQLFRWMVGEGEIAESPMDKKHPLSVPEQPVPVLATARPARCDLCQGRSRHHSQSSGASVAPAWMSSVQPGGPDCGSGVTFVAAHDVEALADPTGQPTSVTESAP